MSRLKCNIGSDMPIPFPTSQTMYLPLISMISLTFESLFLPVAVTDRPNFAAAFATNAVPMLNCFLHQPTV